MYVLHTVGAMFPCMYRLLSINTLYVVYTMHMYSIKFSPGSAITFKSEYVEKLLSDWFIAVVTSVKRSLEFLLPGKPPPMSKSVNLNPICAPYSNSSADVASAA